MKCLACAESVRAHFTGYICATDVDASQRGSYLSLSLLLSHTMHKICTFIRVCAPAVSHLCATGAIFRYFYIFYCHALLLNWTCKQRASSALFMTGMRHSCVISAALLLSITKQLNTKRIPHTKFVFTSNVHGTIQLCQRMRSRLKLMVVVLSAEFWFHLCKQYMKAPQLGVQQTHKVTNMWSHNTRALSFYRAALFHFCFHC